MATLLGLTQSNDLASHASLSARRKVFYAFPNGSAPMTGLLSMADTDSTDKAEFGWYHKRDESMRIVLESPSGGDGPFYPEGATTYGGSITNTTNVTLVDGTKYRAVVEANGTNKLRVNHVVLFKDIPIGGAATTYADFYGVVTEIVTTSLFEFTLTNGANQTVFNHGDAWTEGTSDDRGVSIVGSANPEGSASTTGLWNTPELETNYTQIFKTPFSSTGTSLQEGMIWSDTGHYKDKAWEAMRAHAKELEMAALFGKKTKSQVAHTGGTTYQRTMNGVLSFLREWDTAKSATLNTDSNKRVINAQGTLSYTQFEDYMGRLFTVTNDKNFEKICFCGSNFLQTLNRVIDSKVDIRTTMLGDEKFKFRVAEITTMHGTVYFHTHPLFTSNADFNDSALFVDINNLKLRPLNNRDTQVQENIQANDVDYRKDQYMTEIGLENILPESHLFIGGVTGAA